MKIGIYTDAHFSISSSILSRIHGYKYSARLDSLIASFKWMYEQFSKNEVDLIINCGDLTNSDLLHAEENSALYEALSYNPGTEELYILGNHEIKNKDSTVSSVSILQGYPNIKMYNEVTEVVYGDTHLILVPYLTDKDKYDQAYDILRNSDPNHKYYLFSHMSYIGENYNNYIETEGLDKIHLTTSYDNLYGIFNGHIHNAKDDGLYHQIGSLTGNSFGDSYDGGYPGIIILDTETNKIKRLVNPKSVLFFKTSCSSLKDVSSWLSSIKKTANKCIRIEVPSDIKDETYEFISQNKSKFNIEEFRIKAKYENVSNDSQQPMESLSTYKSSYDALLGFTKSQQSLPYPVEDMVKFLDTYIGGK